MRISDWSSDVCSSDLSPEQPNRAERLINVRIRPVPVDRTLLEGCAHSGDGRFGQWVCGNYTASPLAFRESEGRPAVLHDPRDRPAAFASLALARKSDGEGKSVYIRVDIGGRRISKKQTYNNKKKRAEVHTHKN